MAMLALAFEVLAEALGSQNLSKRSHELVVSMSRDQWAV